MANEPLKGTGPVVVPSSGAALPLMTSSGVLVLGVAALLRSGVRPSPLAVTALGSLLLLTVLLDRPRRTEFTAEGIRRVCPLRSSTLPWSRIVAVERTRPMRPRRGATGGLVARTRRGRWLLSDIPEDPRVHDALVLLMAAAAPHVRLLAVRPGPSVRDASH